MPIRKTIPFLQLLTLLTLLLVGYWGVANPVATSDKPKPQHAQSLNKTEPLFHGNMLQPQVAQVNAVAEHPVKQVNPGFGLLFFNTDELPLLAPFAPAKTILQDVDRCESVSRLLFPYHFFW